MTARRLSPVPTLFAVALAATLPHATEAQVVRGEVSEAGTGTPVQGVFVSLVDSTDARLASTLTDATGRYMLQAPGPGSYALRAERIGFRTTTTDPLTLADGQTVRRSVEVPSTAVELEGISVSAERQCQVEPARADELNRLWDEIRKAFSVAEWVEESGVVRYRVRRFSRRLDPESMTVRRETVQRRTGYAERPFSAPEPASLEDVGYVQQRDGQVFYHAPDVRSLQSDGFIRTHCFRAVRGEDEGTFEMVGLEFTPVEDRDVPDIRGTLWVDESSAELQRLDFGYTGLEGVRRSQELGGTVRFRRLPSGAWIVTEWSIRMPIRGTTQAWWREGPDRTHEVLAGLQEVGGEVVELSTVSGDVDIAGDRATLGGVVWDSLRSEPVPGARVFLNGTSHSTETDELGEFSLAGLPGGRYQVAFHHDRLSERGLYVPPREVELTPGEVERVRLALPSGAAMTEAACAEIHDETSAPEDERAILAGVVRDAVTEAPVPGARVQVEWSGGEGGREGGGQQTQTDDEGRYRFCTLPDGRSATVRASFLEQAVGATAIPLRTGEPEIQDLELDLTQPTPVVVQVSEHESGQPIDGAEVRIEGIDDPVITDAEGRAGFAEVAPGMHDLEVEHLAYGTVRDSILVRSAETVRVRVRMATEAIALDPIEVEVEGRVTTGIGMMGDVEARGTRGDVLTVDEIDDVLPRVSNVPGLLRTANIPGLSITDARIQTGGGNVPAVCIERHRTSSPGMGEGCNMVTVYVNDQRLPNPAEFLLNLDPATVRRIEVLSPVEAGSMYGLYAQNGVVLIYTRTGQQR